MVQKCQTTTWDVKNIVNNGINYQPQLVQDFFCFSPVLSLSGPFQPLCLQAKCLKDLLDAAALFLAFEYYASMNMC